MLQRGFLRFGLLVTVAFSLIGQPTTTDTRSRDSTYVIMFQFSPDGKSIITYTFDGTLSTWDIASRKLLRSQQAKTEKATFDPQGRLLTFVRDEKGSRLIDVVANQDVTVLDGAYFYSTTKFAFGPDGKTLAFDDRDVVKLWDLTTGKEKPSIKRLGPDPDDAGPSDFLNVLIFSPDGQTLAGLSRSITLWSTSTGKRSRSIEINAGLARMAFTPDGKRICVSGFDNMKPSFIKCFEVLSGREVLSVPADPSSPFAFSPDGKMLALNRPGEGIIFISMATGKETGKVTISVDDHSLTQMSFSPDGKLLAFGSADGLVLLDPATGKQLFVLAP